MGSKDGGKTPPCHPSYHHDGGGLHHHHHHHHHCFYISPHCPLHRSILRRKNHSPSCSFSTTYPQPVVSTPPHPQLSFPDTGVNQTFDDSLIIEDEIEKPEDEEEGDPIFVLTDEWRDFFAKSEARRLARRQAKKGKK